MADRLTPSSLLRLGIVLLAVSLAGSFLTPALLGEHQSAAMAHLPLALFTVLGFAFSTAQLLGVALVALSLGIRALGIRAIRPSPPRRSDPESASTEPR